MQPTAGTPSAMSISCGLQTSSSVREPTWRSPSRWLRPLHRMHAGMAFVGGTAHQLATSRAGNVQRVKLSQVEAKSSPSQVESKPSQVQVKSSHELTTSRGSSPPVLDPLRAGRQTGSSS